MVYPRLGGATPTALREVQENSGLSPRGRGNRRRREPSSESKRSIPAWAGQPVILGLAAIISTVYPRVGGATLDALARDDGLWVYPRVGGATCKITSINRVNTGLSPRGRGNPHFGNIVGLMLFYWQVSDI